MGKYSVSEFVDRTLIQERGDSLFEIEDQRFLDVRLNGEVWTKMGSMVCYRGNVKFEREGVLEHGLGKFFKKALTGEGLQLTKASGNGSLYLADQGKKIIILELEGDMIYVNGNDLLAFETGIEWDIKLMKRVTGMMAGGLFNICLQGRGMVAITSHYDPLTLRVTPGHPVLTDPNATVAWSGSLQPELKTDISFRTFLGRGSGESFQMSFEGDGFVVVQPYEELYFQQTASS